MNWCLRTFAALPENPSLVPRSLIWWLTNAYNSSSKGTNALTSTHIHVRSTHTDTQAHTQMLLKINLKNKVGSYGGQDAGPQ